MKFAAALLVALGICTTPCLAQAAPPVQPTTPVVEGNAARSTYLLLYRPGPAWPRGKKVSELPLREHGRYMLSLYKAGRMRMAGPLTDDAGGAVVLDVADEAEARRIVADDPAVKAKLFVSELHPWAPVDWEQYVRKAPVREGRTP
jgi:uncharacterized protein